MSLLHPGLNAAARDDEAETGDDRRVRHAVARRRRKDVARFVHDAEIARVRIDLCPERTWIG